MIVHILALLFVVVDAYSIEFCDNPPDVPHAVNNLMRNQKHYVFKVGEVSFYECERGFRKTTGTDNITCVARSDGRPLWETPTITCDKVKCDDPGVVEHARVSRHPPNSSFEYNTNVNYVCDEGYRMIGVPFLTCKEDGKWNRQKPYCQMKRCPELEALENGNIGYSDAERRTDSKAEYVCDNGFVFNSLHPIRYCRQDDTWSPFSDLKDSHPRCIKVTCDAPARPHTGVRIINTGSRNGGSYFPGDIIIYTCESNKVRAASKCLNNGIWSRGPPHCPISDNACPIVGDIPDGHYNVSNKARDTQPFKVGTKVTFYCNESHLLEGSPTLMCLSSRVWNGSIPKCIVNLQLQYTRTSKLTVLIISIIALVLMVLLISCVLFCRWRQQQLQRRRWQQYFGHYNHRQSKTNIMLNTANEMKCFRTSPHKTAVPVTDL